MANVGSDVIRALTWKAHGHERNWTLACERALELLDLTLDDPRNRSRVKEIARVRECLVDFFYGANEYGSTEESWRKYFDAFAYAARRNH